MQKRRASVAVTAHIGKYDIIVFKLPPGLIVFRLVHLLLQGRADN